MTILQIEHKVQSFERWKKAFESDPIDREKSGVKRYRVYRKNDDANYVIIDLEFNNLNDAQKALVSLNSLWNKVEGTVMAGAKTRILNLIDFKEY
jgi:hypothetical protein